MKSTIRAATILQIIPRIDTGGAEMATLEICQAMTRAGGRCFVLTEGGRMAGDMEKAGGVIMPFPAASKNPARIVANGFALAKFMRERGVDLIHARSRAPAWSALIAARQTGLAFVTTYHGAYGNRGPFKSLYNSVMAKGDLVIANSRYTADLVHSRHGTPRDRIRVVHRGVDLALFNPQTVPNARVEAIRKQWGAAPTDRIVLHAARLTDWKGQRHVIDAAAFLEQAGGVHDLLFVLAGDAQGRDAYVSSLRKQMRKLGVEKRVRIVGHCSDMAAAFAAANVAVVASTEPEAFGRSSAEAQAMGCPVIVTNQGASPETLLAPEQVGREQATGWIVPVGDGSAIAEAVRRALSLTPDGRAAMAMRARAHVVEHFSSDKMKLGTLGVYDEVLRSALARSFADAGEKRER